MDHLLDRVEALAQQLQTLQQQTHTWQQQAHTATRRLRWWKGLASGVLILALLTWAVPVGTAQEESAASSEKKTLEQRVAALESLLKHFSRKGNDVFITKANLHLRNGLSSTDCFDEQGEIPDCPNGLGNLIVGYNELRDLEFFENIRTGSHNVVVGQQHNFSNVGGLVVGLRNEISAEYAVVSGGDGNTASGFAAVVGGGADNTASGDGATISGGFLNTASGTSAAISGGHGNTASGNQSAVSGGLSNTASGEGATISGGFVNTSSGFTAVVGGGQSNTASGDSAAVSGGQNRTAAGEFDWVAGSLFEDE
jgi:hypothetical protein